MFGSYVLLEIVTKKGGDSGRGWVGDLVMLWSPFAVAVASHDIGGARDAREETVCRTPDDCD